jgi:hypothetical protein
VHAFEQLPPREHPCRLAQELAQHPELQGCQWQPMSSPCNA